MNTRLIPLTILVAAGVASVTVSRAYPTAAQLQDTAATVIYSDPVRKPANHALIGYIRAANFRSANSQRSIPYLYLHLAKPIDIIDRSGGSAALHELHVYDIQLVGGGPPDMISKLDKLVGEKVKVYGIVPFVCKGSCRGIIPLEPVMSVVRVTRESGR